jgi:nicotinamide-nucleotide amidase
LGRRLIFQEDLWDRIRDRFRKRGITISQVNRKQAFLIEGSVPLSNPHGTAPGAWLESGERTYVLLPGPPREIQPMFLSQVLPRLQEKREGFRVEKVLKIAGLTESKTEDLIADLYPGIGPDIELTVLASPGQIEIHMTAYSSRSEEDAQEKMTRPARAISGRLGDSVFTHSGEELEEVVGRMLRENHLTLATAESCTGGLLGHRITNVPGSSAYYLAGIQAYSNAAKTRLLNVPASLLDTQGAVSPEAAAVMAENVRADSGADFGLGITGIAGPTGGSDEKPVGLVYIALAGEGDTQTVKNLFLGDRETVKQRSTQKALDMLRRRLMRLARDQESRG